MNIEKNIPSPKSYLSKNNIENNKGKEGLREVILSFFQKNGAEIDLLKEYWEFLEEGREDSEKEGYSDKEKNINIDDAKEHIDSLLSKGVKPIISIPIEYVENIKTNKGIRAQETDIKSVKLIAGVIGDIPYKYDTLDRCFFEINCSAEDLSPRLTGAGYFNGVVVWNKNFIPIDEMHEIKKNSLIKEAA